MGGAKRPYVFKASFRILSCFISGRTGPCTRRSDGYDRGKGGSAVYLARVRFQKDYHFILRETYAQSGVLKSRDLVDLGEDPRACIHYPGGNGYYFDPALEETLREKGVEFTSQDLEDIFVPYLKPRIQRIIRAFENRRSRPAGTGCRPEGPAARDRVHIFDARRLYYLRFGRVDSGELGLKHWKFLNIFLCKSRDEIESVIEAMEYRLPPREYAAYVYASLGVPLFFSEPMRDYPSALDREKLDGLIIRELCRLNGDESYFLGVERPAESGLHPYLTKYAWLYFDSDFPAQTLAGVFGFETRCKPPAPPSRSMRLERAYEIFGISAQRFARMSKRELTCIYRRKAKKMHPDQGGVHEDFLELSEAYEALLATMK